MMVGWIKMEVETKVKNGFPCIVEYEVSRYPEDPDSGLFGRFEFMRLTTMKGKNADWLEARLSDSDWDAIADAISEHAQLLEDFPCEY